MMHLCSLKRIRSHLDDLVLAYRAGQGLSHAPVRMGAHFLSGPIQTFLPGYDTYTYTTLTRFLFDTGSLLVARSIAISLIRLS